MVKFLYRTRRELHHKEEIQFEKTKYSIVLFVVYILLLAGIILFKLPLYSTPSDGIQVVILIPFQGSFDENGVFLFREVIYNIFIFIPLGVYICMFKSEWIFMGKVLPIIGLSLTFEVIQFIFALGRSGIVILKS